jgi:hypothetical protein
MNITWLLMSKLFKSPLLVTIGRWLLFWFTLLLILVTLTLYVCFFTLIWGDKNIVLSDIGMTYTENFGGAFGKQMGRISFNIHESVALVMTVTLLVSMARHIPCKRPSSKSLCQICDLLSSFVYGFIPTLFRPSFANCMIVAAGMICPLIAITIYGLTIMGW